MKTKASAAENNIDFANILANNQTTENTHFDSADIFDFEFI